MECRYPSIVVRLVGEDGNAFSILGRVLKAMKEARLPAEEISKFFREATGGDYDHLLRTVLTWVRVE